jgi:hypothetical protein
MSRAKLRKLSGRWDQNKSAWVFFLPLFLLMIKNQFRISNFDSLNNLPYKDALNWSNCTKSLALFGDFPGGEMGSWCLRRPIFAEISARIYGVTGSLFSLFVIYSLVFGACLYWNHKLILRYTRPSTSWLITSIQLGYWSIYSTGQFLSENLGIILGAIACGFLLKTYFENNMANILATSFWLSLALLVRPSNLFLLLIPIFSLLSARYALRQKIAGAFFILIVEFAPIIIVRFASSVRGEGDYGNAGNAWSSLYGLANGNSSWTSAYSNLPPNLSDSDYSNIIKSRTWELIHEDPLGIPRSILENLVSMFGSGFPFFTPEQLPLGVISNISGVVFAIFILFSLYRLTIKSSLPQEVQLSLIFIMFYTIIFFAISWKSEPVRVLSPFLPFLFLSLILSNSRFNRLDRKGNRTGSKYSIIVWILIPITFLTLNTFTIYSKKQTIAASKLCAPGEFSLNEKSIDFVDITRVRANKFFSWGEFVLNAPSGVLVQGISSTYPHRAHSVFIPNLTNATSISLSRFCMRVNSETNENIASLGYTEVQVKS